MCNHSVFLQRRQRRLWEKLLGVKEVYVCSRCGYIKRVRSFG